MVFKPRKKRLSRDKVMANLAAQQERLAKPNIPKTVQRAAGQAFAEASQQHRTKFSAAFQAAAEINPVYRPLVGRDDRETAKLLQQYVETLSPTEKDDLILSVTKHMDVSFEEMFELVGLALLVSGGEFKPESEPSSDSQRTEN